MLTKSKEHVNHLLHAAISAAHTFLKVMTPVSMVISLELITPITKEKNKKTKGRTTRWMIIGVTI
jgi:hypothetical protein